MTASTWQKDYAALAEMKKSTSLARKKPTLVAYVLRNLTGSPLRFATQTASMHGAGYSGKGEGLRGFKLLYGCRQFFVFYKIIFDCDNR